MIVSLNKHADRFRTWFDALPADHRQSLTTEYFDGLFADGYYITEQQSKVTMPAVLSPQVLDESEMAELRKDSQSLLVSLTKLARWLIDGDGKALADTLFSKFVALEHVASTKQLDTLAIGRADYFIDDNGRPWVLELNSTIPALPGYTELTTQRWLRTMTAERHVDLAAAQAKTWSPTQDLYRSMMAHYQLQRGDTKTPATLIVARPGDPQVGELLVYERMFRDRGHRALSVPADEITIDATGRMCARDEPYDLMYRHVFARRVDPAWPIASILREPGNNVICNPVTSPLEVKGMLAVLSQALADPAPAKLCQQIDLTNEEIAALRRILPWTRMLQPGPASLPDGSTTSDFVDWVQKNKSHLVLKKSWDYGGKGVYIGPNTDDWQQRVNDASCEPGVWIVQQLIAPQTTSHYFLRKDAAGTLEAAWFELTVDLGVYVSQGTSEYPVAITSRASSTAVVNISGGGGLVPVIPSAAFELLFG